MTLNTLENGDEQVLILWLLVGVDEPLKQVIFYLESRRDEK